MADSSAPPAAAAEAPSGEGIDPTNPKVLVLGGTGFIGRNLVMYLVQNNLCSLVRVADKKPPATAFFSPDFAAIFKHPMVEFKQANINNDAGIAKVFTLEPEGTNFDFVFNCAGETGYGQVYENGVTGLTRRVATAAAERGVRRFVELSTAEVYEPKNKTHNEAAKMKPWTKVGRYKAEAETALASIPNLSYNILRPAMVYGPGDSQGIMPRVVCGAVYKHLGEKYKVLWSGDLKTNTVHVRDVARAAWHCALRAPPKAIFNLADKGNTDQAQVNQILEALFGIKTGFVGSMLSNLAKMDMSGAKSFANDKHMEPWAEITKRAGILNTPLTPYIHEELLSDNHLSVDGSAIEGTGFEYTVPRVTVEAVRECIDGYVQQNLFPGGML